MWHSNVLIYALLAITYPQLVIALNKQHGNFLCISCIPSSQERGMSKNVSRR